jgi:hypothetical protein
MRARAWVLALLLVLVRPLAGQDAVLAIEAQTLAALGAIADTAHVEHFRCLLGGWRGDTLYVVMAYEPGVVVATATILAPEACPPLLTVGTWHNHIPRTVSAMGEQLGQTKAAVEYCFLSAEDQRADAGVPLKIVSVTREVSCAWVFAGGQYRRLVHWPPTDRPPARAPVPPLLGWLIVLALACALLLAAGSAIYAHRTRGLARRATQILDSLGRGRWVQLDSSDVVIRKRVGR